MKRWISWAAFALFFAAAPGFAATTALQSSRDCHLRGSEEALRCHVIPVPLDPGRKDGEQLPLHVTVAPAYRQMASADPLFVLAGGPGQAGSDIVNALPVMFQRVRATRDIVFIDQRGTGLSGRMRCKGSDIDEAPSDAAMAAAFAQCVKSIRQPLAMYNTANAAHDIERVRLALGYGPVNVFGGSYGTRLGQSYARLYPASVRSLILDAVAAPDQVIPAGAHDAQLALDGVFQRCARDAACNKAFPDLKAEFDAVLARVNSGAVTLDFPHPRTALPTRLPLTNLRFVTTIHGSLYSPLDSQRLPYLIHSAYQGNWGPFLTRGYAGSDVTPEGLMALPLYMAVVCAEDMPRLAPAMRDDDERGSFMRGHATRIASLCRMLDLPAIAPAAATTIAVPALLLSGALDPITPPHRAASAAKTMPKAQLLTVAQAGHGVSGLGCTPRLLREFLDRPDQRLAADCLNEIAPVSFQLGHAGAQP
ncbi:alpha/beta fold hydrolase [Rugamonas aquatica]|uniref:Proline iminopeptidase n=1 Tax=Rugamonas aquatica TaxID=2743357 RepID=A0A6A7N410_9BURK|nr:alpha/beta fold hydrolase [Rugamonas aquatica]MQA39793.1 alpha/beta fold hydrolase [Rugamonas aquatica]